MVSFQFIINMRIKRVSQEIWLEVDGKLFKSFEFENFKQALDFINQIATLAEVMNHHPEIRNVYNKVDIILFTHDKSKITEKDYTLEEKIDKIYSNF